MSNLPSPKANLVKQAIEMFRKKPTKTVGFNSGETKLFKAGDFVKHNAISAS